MGKIYNVDLYEKAQKHHKEMKEKYANETSYSVKNSKVYRNDDLVRFEYDAEPKTNISIVKQTSADALFENSDEKYCLLNFASFKRPGGGYLSGAKAQEEMLCHESNLYNVIGDAKFKKDYEFNRDHPNYGLYENFAMYSPDIVFHRGSEEAYCDVITCPAPNYREFSKYGSYEQNLVAMRDRIEFMLNVAIDNNCENLILGAWGCGVFQQNAKDVVALFRDYLTTKYEFTEVIFAIPDDKNYNLFLAGI